MKAERIDAVWMEDHYLLSIDELDDRWGLSRSQLQEFIAHGVLEPIGDRPGEDRFNLAAVSMVRTAPYLDEVPGLSSIPGVGLVSSAVQGALKALIADGSYKKIFTENGVESGAISDPAINAAQS